MENSTYWKMNVLHTIFSMGASSGGTSSSTYTLVKGLNEETRCHTDLLTLRSRSPLEKILGDGEPFMHALPNDSITPLRVSFNVRRFLKNIRQYDLLHLNGLWQDIIHASARTAHSINKPYVLTLHGMLYPQALSRRAWKKKLMLALGHADDIRNSSCIHVTCEEEMLHVRNLGFTNPVAIIPNAVPIPSGLEFIRKKDRAFRVGFLGRLHPIKNIEALIRAWGRLPNLLPSDELLIMGEGEPEYVRTLHKLVDEIKAHHVRFTGTVSSDEKFNMLGSLTCLCLPSKTENFGLSIAESLLAGTPVIASTATPWSILNTLHCGWWADNSEDSLLAFLHEARNTSEMERTEMGNRGRKLVLSRYSPPRIAQQMFSLYQFLTNQGEKPEYIFDAHE